MVAGFSPDSMMLLWLMPRRFHKMTVTTPTNKCTTLCSVAIRFNTLRRRPEANSKQEGNTISQLIIEIHQYKRICRTREPCVLGVTILHPVPLIRIAHTTWIHHRHIINDRLIIMFRRVEILPWQLLISREKHFLPMRTAI